MIKKYIKRLESLRRERSPFITEWMELSDYNMSHRGRFLLGEENDNNKDRRATVMYNNKSRLALRTLASGMMSGITSPARPWFKLEVNSDISESPSVKEWINAVQTKMYSVFNASNFYNSMHALYAELGCFGTAVIGVFEDFDKVIHCETFTCGSYFIAEDGQQRVNTFYREYSAQVGSVVNRFGYDNCSTHVQQKWDKGLLDEWVQIVHAVEPNTDHDKNKPMAKFKKFKSVYFELKRKSGDEKYLSESGFDEFPIAAARWETVLGDIYATECPAMIALGDTKALQLGEKRLYQAVDKVVNPPMIGDALLQATGGKKILLPDNVTWATNDTQGLRSIYENYRPDLQAIKMINNEAELRVSKAFYEDLFLMISQSDRRQITATEIAEKQEEKLLALGPVLERLHSELLDPIIDRVFSIMFNGGLFPPVPQELENIDLKVEYISILAQAQRIISVTGIERMINFTGQLGAAWPEALAKINISEVIDSYAKALGVDPSIINADEVVEAMKAQQAQQQQQMQQMQMAEQATGMAKTASEIDGGNIQQLMSDAGLA